MLVCIDESGCPGFKFSRGSDRVFGIGMVIFGKGEDARATLRAIQTVRAQMQHWSEFKFSKSSDATRDAFFQAVVPCPFRVRALIVRKELIYSPLLRQDHKSFYRYFVKMLMKHDNGILQAADVRIDGSGSQEFRQTLGNYLRDGLDRRISNVRMSDSAADPLVQLADMCIGAITRPERSAREDSDRWLKMLAPRIANIWRFR
jgi:hypothetical protein